MVSIRLDKPAYSAMRSSSLNVSPTVASFELDIRQRGKQGRIVWIEWQAAPRLLCGYFRLAGSQETTDGKYDHPFVVRRNFQQRPAGGLTYTARGPE